MYTAQGTLDREATVDRYAPMVRRVANQLAGRLPASVDIGDLVQAGMIGLMDAMTRFDENGGAQFETFATQRVRGAMLDELRGTDWLPRSARRAQRTIEQHIGELEQSLQRPPTEAEIADAMNLDLAEYQKMLGEARGSQLVYIDDLGGRDNDEGFLDRHAPDEPTSMVELLKSDEFRDALTNAMSQLPEREQMVMSMY